jgi:hypothetical protein
VHGVPGSNDQETGSINRFHIETTTKPSEQYTTFTSINGKKNTGGKKNDDKKENNSSNNKW